ncbi:hypothetical protein BUALT_Bualt15G0041800 [Buddleja alternifolia]|uniref:RING-type E3 ubiquitin transferase n=1 Tax=Buddleja alternifolia TaxID=168488 RepID=A0AAV6WLK5_9LAMI|nr:hypothetical protein BUALT_Bualt15G0041800 [Buddleja alternifolia]
MQRERSALDSFPEPFDLNQGSFPNNNSMDNSPSWDNMLEPVENRMSNYILASSDGNISCTNASNSCTQSFNGWDHGESSSSANNQQRGAHVDDSKTTVGWSPCSVPDAASENWPNISNTSFISNQVTGRSLHYQNYPSNRSSLNVTSNNDFHRGPVATEQIPIFYTSSSNLGTSSGSSSTFLENNDASGASFGTRGSSCKRKALEGTSGQFCPGGSSSSNQPMGKNIMQDPVPNSYAPPGNLSISSGPLNLSPMNHSEQLNLSSGVGMSRAAPGYFPSSSNPVIAESSSRNFTIRSNPVPFNTPIGPSVRNFGVYASQQQSRALSSTDSSELRAPQSLPTNPTNTVNQPHLMHVNEARGTHSYPWTGTLASRGGSSSRSFMGERASEVNVRSSRRNNLEYPMTISASETRDVVEDQIDWSFSRGASASSRNRSSGPQARPSSGGRASSASWLPQQNQNQNHQRLSEAASWIPFPRVESDSGIRRSHVALFPSASPSSNEVATTSRAHNQLDQRSASFLMDMAGDDVNGRRALSAVESRHRLIRQVLNAMRRGVHLQAEDYMLIDPFINGFAELHDRHRDMRLDVDNMSYEELLALEERIGDVSTGLSEEKIGDSMKQRKYGIIGVSPNMEPCCICQEDYITGDDVGILDCGHEFHTCCVKQWLSVKNLCPICKMTALKT